MSSVTRENLPKRNGATPNCGDGGICVKVSRLKFQVKLEVRLFNFIKKKRSMIVDESRIIMRVNDSRSR